MMSIDIAVLEFFNITLSSSLLDIFFISICDFNIWKWPAFLIIASLLWKGGPKARWMILLAALTVLVIDPSIYRIIKPLTGRLRPCHNDSLEWVRIVDGCGGRYSFPSSHAANFFGIATAIGFFYRSTRIYLFPLAILIAIGRVYLGVHFPSDVLAGAIYGMAIGSGVVLIAKKVAPDRIGRYLLPRKNIEDTSG